MRNRLWALFDRLAIALLCGAITNLLVMVPPQHGKSRYWSEYFPAWVLRCQPNWRILLASYAANYAAGWGRAARDAVIRSSDLLGSDVRDDVSGASEWKLLGSDGGMITSGVEGGIAGRPAELALCDDPIKDAATASSKVEKDKIWTWWEEEFSARLQGRTALLPQGGRRVLIMTRRAVDDPIGRVLDLVKAGKESWCIVRLPAIAEELEDWPELGWYRKPGEALVPELHSKEELEATEEARNPNTWAGLYQQRPYPRGGGNMKGDWFKIVESSPAAVRVVRVWDLAYSESPSAKQTAGVRMSKWLEGASARYHISHVDAFRLNSGRRNARILETAKLDGKNVPILIEQEPGSGGPAQIEEIKRLLDGYSVNAVVASSAGSKEIRADAMKSQAELGNFTLLSGKWNLDFKTQADSFPGGLIDMIDAAAHAYNYLAGPGGPIKIPVGYTGSGLPGTRYFGAGRIS